VDKPSMKHPQQKQYCPNIVVIDGPFIHLSLPAKSEKTPINHEMIFLKISCTYYTQLLTDHNRQKNFIHGSLSTPVTKHNGQKEV
jgi:hypothetical protein